MSLEIEVRMIKLICIGPEIDATAIGRRLEDFPEMVEDHNEAVKELEEYLVKYLKGGKMANKRPTLKKGGFLGIGGQKHVSSLFSSHFFILLEIRIAKVDSSGRYRLSS